MTSRKKTIIVVKISTISDTLWSKIYKKSSINLTISCIGNFKIVWFRFQPVKGFCTLMCADNMITYTCKIINEKNYNYSHIKFNYQLKNRINSFHKK